MNDGDYLEIVNSERELVKARMRFLIDHSRVSDDVRQKIWLLLLGLIETWDLIK